jgi:tetratricopeptide (TPR) repeat protein
MEKVLRLVLVAAISLGASSAAAAQESWVGKTILIKRPCVNISRTGDDGKQVDVAELKAVDIMVLADMDGRLLVNDGRGHTGWLEKADAILPQDAVRYYSECIGKNPKDAEAFFFRGVAGILTGEIENAAKDMEAALHIDPSPRNYNGRAIIWFAKHEYDNAIADHDEALRLDPKSDSTYLNRGVAWAAKDVREKAIADFTEAIRLDSKCSVAYFNRGLQWHRTKNYDKAIADHTEALRLDSGLAVAYSARGTAWQGKQQYDRAIADFNDAIRLDPKSVYALINRGDAWASVKDFANAIADFDKAVRLDPNCRDAYLGRAWIWATCPEPKYRDGKKAIESAREGIALDPNNAWCMTVLATAYAEAGDFADALRWQEKALEDPQLKNDKDARRRLELYRDKKPYRQE